MVGAASSLPARERVILFGAHKGQQLGSLSSAYLRWIAAKKSLTKGHWTIWAELANKVLHERNDCRVDLSDDCVIDNGSWRKIFDQFDFDDIRVSSATCASLLRWCGNVKSLAHGKRVHHHIVRSGLQRDTYLGSLLVQMYGDCGALEEARSFFDTMHRRNVFSWNFMIRAYVLNGQGKEGFSLFEQMNREEVMPDRVTFLGILASCEKANLSDGKRIHNIIMSGAFASDVNVGNAIITMYGNCGSPHDAQRIFDKMPRQDVITWNAIIAAFGQNGLGQQALGVFGQMQQEGVIPNNVTYVSILDACASQVALAEGERMHTYILVDHNESNVVLGTALVSLYGKCGKLEVARRIFGRICNRNVVSWTAMIAAYSQNNCSNDALELFALMEQEGVSPNKLTFICIIDACASHASWSIGEQILARITKSGVDVDVVMGTALVNMYGRCGRLEDARRSFDQLSVRDVASWNAMIAAYAQHGLAKNALELLDQMTDGGIMPDTVTYVSILSVCSHTGLVNEGCQLFGFMTRVHGIIPIEDHYNCMIDLLGRAAQLDEAEELISKMPFQPSVVSVMSLLGACRQQVDVKRGERIAEILFRLDPENASPYAMLSNIYAAAGMEEEAAKVIYRMKSKGLQNSMGAA